MTDDGRALQDTLMLRRQAINAGPENGLYGGRHLDNIERSRQAVLVHSGERLGFHERADALLEKERIPLGPLDQESLERLQTRVLTDECAQQLVRQRGRQGIEPHLRVVGLPAPAVCDSGRQLPSRRIRLVGMLSTRLSSRAWVSESTQCRSSRTVAAAAPGLRGASAASQHRAYAVGAGVDRVPATRRRRRAHRTARVAPGPFAGVPPRRWRACPRPSPGSFPRRRAGQLGSTP